MQKSQAQKQYLNGKVQQQVGGQGAERLINRSNKFRCHRSRVSLRRKYPHTRNREDVELL